MGREMNGRSPEDESNAGDFELEIARMPDVVIYRSGEAIDYAGLVVKFAGLDVTAESRFSVEDGTVWRADDAKLEVFVTFVDEDGEWHLASFVLKRKRSALPFALVLCAIGLVVAGGFAWWLAQPRGDTGSYIIPQGDMTDEEARSMLDEQVERSRITVSLRPTQELTRDGRLHVNFVVVADNNGFSERLEIEQDGHVVYASGVVEPEHAIAWCDAPSAHAGPATATVYAVGSDGLDSGNPVSVEIEIVDDAGDTG